MANDDREKILYSESILGDVDKIFNLGSGVEEYQVSDDVVTFWPKKILKSVILGNQGFIIKAEKNEIIIGFIVVNYNSDFGKSIIENVYVSPEYRGTRVSDGLLRFVIKKLKDMRCEYLCTLIENKSESAISLYIRNGFSRGIDCAWLDKILDDSFER